MFIGTTERGDAGLDFSWVNRLYLANIIISKNLNDTLIEKLVENKSKVIFHHTVTGLGGTNLEPHVPGLEWSHSQFKKLIAAGFPVEQVVLRIDPIIPHPKTLHYATNVLNMYVGEVSRVRYSFLDMYPHVIKRFTDAGIGLPYKTFTAPKASIDNALQVLNSYKKHFTFEACGEFVEDKVGCVSQKDLNILNTQITPSSTKCQQRNSCMCMGNKKELLRGNMFPCPHGCLYCFWKD